MTLWTKFVLLSQCSWRSINRKLTIFLYLLVGSNVCGYSLIYSETIMRIGMDWIGSKIPSLILCMISLSGWVFLLCKRNNITYSNSTSWWLVLRLIMGCLYEKSWLLRVLGSCWWSNDNYLFPLACVALVVDLAFDSSVIRQKVSYWKMEKHSLLLGGIAGRNVGPLLLTIKFNLPSWVKQTSPCASRDFLCRRCSVNFATAFVKMFS